MGPEVVNAEPTKSGEVVAAKSLEEAGPASTTALVSASVEPAVPQPALAPDPIKASFGSSLRAIAERYIKEGDELFRYEPSTLKSEVGVHATGSSWEKVQALAPLVAQKVTTAVSVFTAGLTAVFGLTSIVSLFSGEPGVAFSTALMSAGFGFVTNALWNNSRQMVAEMKEADKGASGAAPIERNGSEITA